MSSKEDQPMTVPDDADYRAFSVPPTRRSFLKRVGAGVLIGIPALRTLVTPGTAFADPPHKHCYSERRQWLSHICHDNIWYVTYKLVCSVCLDWCGENVTECDGSC